MFCSWNDDMLNRAAAEWDCHRNRFQIGDDFIWIVHEYKCKCIYTFIYSTFFPCVWTQKCLHWSWVLSVYLLLICKYLVLYVYVCVWTKVCRGGWISAGTALENINWLIYYSWVCVGIKLIFLFILLTIETNSLRFKNHAVHLFAENNSQEKSLNNVHF